jgi:hypothetical protein
MKHMRKTAGYYRTDRKVNTEIATGLNSTLILDEIQRCKRKWTQHVNRMPRNGLPRILKNYTPEGRRNQGRPVKRLLDK